MVKKSWLLAFISNFTGVRNVYEILMHAEEGVCSMSRETRSLGLSCNQWFHVLMNDKTYKYLGNKEINNL